MNGTKWPLSDLGFFRFPELTGGEVRNIALLLGLLVLVVLVTVLLHRKLQHSLRFRSRRAQFDRFSSEHHMEPPVRAVLERLMGFAQVADEFALVHDAEAFEAAVERLVEEADDAALESLHRLRRTLHLNVMNPEVALVSTRQLLEDLPVRLLANIGPERLDLYCALLDVDEQYLLVDLPPHDEIFRLLEAHPDVFLIFWREREGEAVFRIALEPIEDGRFPAFRARHALRDISAQHRSGFRLSVDLPGTYRFLDRAQLGRRRGSVPAQGARDGDARVIDLSYGGASLVVQEPLQERGLAQLSFELQGQPVRLMLEILTRTTLDDGRYLLRGQFRGLGEEARVRLNAMLHREQIKRLRDKHLLHIRPGA